MNPLAQLMRPINFFWDPKQIINKRKQEQKHHAQKVGKKMSMGI